jgi:hypothetical protein
MGESLLGKRNGEERGQKIATVGARNGSTKGHEMESLQVLTWSTEDTFAVQAIRE